MNCSTCYLHYETISDLLNETMEQMLSQFIKGFPQEPEEFIQNIEKANLKDLMLINEEYLTPYLVFIKDNRNVYRAAFRNPASMQTYHTDAYRKKILTVTHIVLVFLDFTLIAPIMDMALEHRNYTFGLIPAILLGNAVGFPHPSVEVR